MDHSKFVPTLADLIKANRDWGIQCCWQRKPKGRQVPGRCGNNITAVDIQERNRLIVRIRTLTGAYLERREPSRSTSNIVSKIRDALEKISVCFLCVRWHRIYSSTIVQMWCDELNKLDEIVDLEDPNEFRGQPAKSNSREESTTLKNASTAGEIDVRTELNIQHGDKIFCHGENKDGTNCLRLISVKNSRQAAAVIETLSKKRGVSQATKDNLSLLASLLLCQRSHQDQAADKAKEWLKKLEQVLQQVHTTREPVPASNQSSTPQAPATPPPRRAKRTESLTPESVASAVFSRASSIPFESPPTTLPRSRRYSASEDNVDSPSPSILAPRKTAPPSTQPETNAIGRITRASTFTLPPVDAVSKFILHSPKSREAVRTKVYEKIKRTIIQREKSAGYIYGFIREGDKHIKIGYTYNIGSRISNWNSKCRQSVKVILEEYLPHAAKVESLVHAILHKQRRREVLVGGRCNGGKGCATAHEEWFDVTVELLREIVGLCKRWINAKPYNPLDGVLKPVWAAYVDKLYFAGTSHRREEWHDWLDVAKATVTSVVRIVVPPKVEERATTTITQTEIKSEEDDTPLADVADRLRDLSTISRIYTETIKGLKTEAPKDIPLNGYPADRSICQDDPFTAPLAAAA